MAAAVAAGSDLHRGRRVRLVLLCLAQYVVGLATMGLGLHIYHGDVGQVVFDAGLLIASCGPVWAVLLTLWLEENR